MNHLVKPFFHDRHSSVVDGEPAGGEHCSSDVEPYLHQMVPVWEAREYHELNPKDQPMKDKW